MVVPNLFFGKVQIKHFRVILSAVFLALIIPAAAWSLNIPAMNGPVNDLAGIMSASEQKELTDYLLEVDRQTAAQIAVLTIPSLEGDDIESISIRTAEKWQLGEQDTDLGVLIVVALAERQMRIEAGYGAEAELTDAKCGLIIRNIMAPAFRNNKYGEGIIAASKTVADVLTGGVDAQTRLEQMKAEDTQERVTTGLGTGFLFFFIFTIMMISLSRGFTRRSSRYGGAFLFPMFFPRSGGGFGSGSSFGGGFHGGGGGFGGGGASGRW
jgi:uncharacterized protein